LNVLPLTCGNFPVSASWITIAALYRSERASTGWPASCSGDM
jgi:hypothetical protein